jgi:hypothetical protein
MADDPDPSQFAFHPPTVDPGAPSSAPKKPTHYDIVDTHTKSVVGRAASLSRALRSVDKRDNEYGAVRYMHRPVYGD